MFVFDYISWIPYLKNKRRNNFNCEINNQEIFYKILEINSENEDLFDLFFSFKGSGSAKIIKTSDLHLRQSSRLKSRKYTLKNLIRKFFRVLK